MSSASSSRRSLVAPLIAGLLGVSSAVLVTTAPWASGAGAATETVFVPITPCRLLDTRPATQVGPRSSPLPAATDVTFGAHDGDDGDSTCAIPASATAIGTNVTAVNPNAPSFLTLFPADADRPNASNLNYGPGSPPTPNAVTVPLAGDGRFKVFNRNGTVNVIVDVNGYYQPSTNVGDAGPAGASGVAGAPGADGADGADALDGRPDRLSRDQIAELAWHDDPALPIRIPTGGSPIGIVSDGTHLFTANLDGTVSVLDPVAGVRVDNDPAPGVQDIDVAANATAITFAFDRIWVATVGPAPGNLAQIEVIDPTTLAIDTTISPISLGVTGVTGGIAATADRLFVTVGQNLFRIDPTNGSVDSQDLGTALRDVLWVPNGLNGSEIWIAALDDAEIFIRSAASPFTGSESIDTGLDTFLGGMVSTGSHVYVPSDGTDGVFKITVGREVIDANGGAGNDIGTGPAPQDVTYDGRWLYVLDFGTGDIIVVDPVTNGVLGAVAGTISIATEIYFDGTRVWVSAQGANELVGLIPR